MMPESVTPDQVVDAAKELDKDEFTRDDLKQQLGVDKLRPGFKAAREGGRIEKVGENEDGDKLFHLTGQ